MRFILSSILLLLAGQLFSQATLSGTILDTEGEPIVGAAILIVNSNTGTTTNEAGQFSLDNIALGDQEIEISYLGYVTQVKSLDIKKSTNELMPINLVDAIASFDAVLVKAIRAGENAPITYTDISREELQRSNLGQDVPYLLRWTPSTVVTSDAGTGIGYTGISLSMIPNHKECFG